MEHRLERQPANGPGKVGPMNAIARMLAKVDSPLRSAVVLLCLVAVYRFGADSISCVVLFDQPLGITFAGLLRLVCLAVGAIVSWDFFTQRHGRIQRER